MAPPGRSQWTTFLWNVLKYTPFVIVTGLFLFAWGTLTFSLAIGYNIVRVGAWAKGLGEIIITQVLAGLALASFMIAVFKNPGTPTRTPASRRHHPTAQSSSAAYHNRDVEGLAALTRDQEREEEAEYNDRDVSAPLLPEAGILPGQPQFPARTGRQQFHDLVNSADSTNRIKASGLMVKSSGDSRWCAKCDAPKPDRAHHCSTCGVCVLRMDHHCPWLASSCVGLRTHKAFFLFLLHTSLLCAYAAQETARALVVFVLDEDDGFEESPISWAAVLFIGFIFSVALIPFTAYHAYLICKNRTTIESMEGAGRIRVRAADTAPGPIRSGVEHRLQDLVRRDDSAHRASSEAGARKSSEWKSDEALSRDERRALKRAAKVNIYDLGIAENWRQLMGRHWWLWFIPVGEP